MLQLRGSSRLISFTAIAETDSVVKVKKKTDSVLNLSVSKVNDKPVTNFRLNITDNFRFDSNTVVDEKSLFTGKYESDVGAIYRFTDVDSTRFSLNQNNNSVLINFRHKF